ncbi:MAG TPA: thermonuclease family protein, partial [Dehalococcoidia bacterium]|nr:thermonuclease family protein [Dehalococcoidia bacterium]
PRLLTIRYYGVDTPERGDKCYREAQDRNMALVGKEVLLLEDARDEDRFGRTLRYVFLPDGTSLDATLVAEGFGHAWTRDGRYKEEIVALQLEAEAGGRGCLWK